METARKAVPKQVMAVKPVQYCTLLLRSSPSSIHDWTPQQRREGMVNASSLCTLLESFSVRHEARKSE